MKLVIQEIERKPINTKKGPATKVGVKSNGVWYSCFENQTTKSWQQGDEIDVQVEKNGQYNNIVFPKQAPYQPNNAQMNDAIKDTLSRLERKIDRILNAVMPTGLTGNIQTGKVEFTTPKDIPQMPFEDSPFPRDEDQY